MKKFISILMAIVLLSSCCLAKASEDHPLYERNNIIANQKDQEIISIISQLLEHNTEKVIAGTQSSNLDSFELEKESQLQDLGVEILNDQEVAALIGNSLQSIYMGGQETINVTVPSTTNDIRWYSTRTNYTVSNVTYEVQHITATARTNNTNLAAHGAKVHASSDSNPDGYVVNIFHKLVEIYAHKIASYVLDKLPVVGWLPYEFIPVGITKVSNASTTYQVLSSTSFSFVKISGQDDYYQVLSETSNYIKFSGSTSVSGVNNGTPVSNAQVINETTYADGFVNTANAVNAYINNSVYRSYIDGYEFNFCGVDDNNYTFTDYIVYPTFNMMGQIY